MEPDKLRYKNLKEKHNGKYNDKNHWQVFYGILLRSGRDKMQKIFCKKKAQNRTCSIGYQVIDVCSTMCEYLKKLDEQGSGESQQKGMPETSERIP